MRILVVEDDGPIAEAVAYALEKEGMRADRADSVASARAKLREADLVILDLGLPDGSGFTLIGEIRRWARVIVLTSRDEDVECVAALEAGADDFVAKPFSPRALVARVRAVLRRSAPAEVSSGLEVDTERRTTTFAGRSIALTKTEFDLLAVLAETPGRVRTRAHLVARVWGDTYALTERTVDSHFKGLRKKLEGAGAPPALLETVRGIGFKLRESP
jgi:two-component system catabolic regulation response regulator CreB